MTSPYPIVDNVMSAQYTDIAYIFELSFCADSSLIHLRDSSSTVYADMIQPHATRCTCVVVVVFECALGFSSDRFALKRTYTHEKSHTRCDELKHSVLYVDITFPLSKNHPQSMNTKKFH